MSETRVTIEDFGDNGKIQHKTVWQDLPDSEVQGYPQHLACVMSEALHHHLSHHDWTRKFLDEFLIQLFEWAECEGYSLGQHWDRLAETLSDEEDKRIAAIEQPEPAP